MAIANSGRALALARRKALSSGGKAGLGGGGSQPKQISPVPELAQTLARHVSPRPASNGVVGNVSSGGRRASLERRRAMSARGKLAIKSSDRTRSAADRAATQATSAQAAPSMPAKDKECECGCGGASRPRVAKQTPLPNNGTSAQSRLMKPLRPAIQASPGKAAALARRKALSSRGKAALHNGGMSEAQTARATNPGLTGRKLAQALREQRSRRGSAGQKKSAPTGRQRQQRNGQKSGAAQDAPWKVGASETTHGQTVTGTMVGRDRAVTGDEPSTCRAVTGTEYMGAEIFREFCQAEPVKSPIRVGKSSTARGNAVTGNEVGRSTKVTGDEPGTCKRITGSEYISAEQAESFCGTRAEPVPSRVSSAETTGGKQVTGTNVGRDAQVTGAAVGADRVLTGTQYTGLEDGGGPVKVGHSKTLRGSSVSGTLVGRREKMTGDEAGSCRNITGDDYIGEEQYLGFCNTKPQPADRKVGVSSTLGGEAVTGTMTGRSTKVTGDEPGTCKAITGTPYAGSEQYASYCESPAADQAQARMKPSKRTFGMPMTGQQPAVGGRTTGDAKGACESVSGTPYVGADQVNEACPAAAAEPGSPDFPQPLGGAPWGEFSLVAPAQAAQGGAADARVTGLQYEQGHITGPFGMAAGKVTGTEEARFGGDRSAVASIPQTAQQLDGRVKSRITGEGMDAGHKITGDDWDRGDQVTGTEGVSSMRRNPTLRGAPMSAMGARAIQTREQAPEPVSKVTGSSGNTDRGAVITFSGGARG